jgi:hypothetical protein
VLGQKQNPRREWRRVAPPFAAWVLCPHTFGDSYTFRQSIAIGSVILMLMVLRIYKGFAIPAKSALTIPLSLSSVKTDLTLGMHHIVHGRS